MNITSQKKGRTKNKGKAKTNEPTHECHIHDKAGGGEIDEIRKNVCVSDDKEHPLEEFEGKHYCLFHKPTKDKDAEKFYEIFHARLNEIDKKCAEIEAEFPDDEEKQLEVRKERTIDYDFRYVWFPAKLDLNNRKFSADAYFSSATFSADAYFSSATFSADADFNLVTFSADTYFSSATFSADADFSLSIFEDKSQTYFIETRFCGNVAFNKAEISGFMEFDGKVFLDKEVVQAVKEELDLKNIKAEQEAVFSFQEVRLFKPERVSFNSMKLQPNWFVNVDEARRITFNDVVWLNLEIDLNPNGLDKELESLKKRKLGNLRNREIEKRKVLYRTACNQLADNAEANRRYREAEKLRKQGIVLNNEKNKTYCHIHDAVDQDDKKEIREEVCKQYPVVNEDGGNYYCLIHNPDKNKAEIFLKEFEKIKKDCTDFRSVVFPITVNYGEDMPDKIDFTGAIFQRNVVFENAEFEKLDFSKAFFKEESELVFKESKCQEAIILDKADIDGKLFIYGDDNQNFFEKEDFAFSIKEARIEKPHWINFRSVRLLPHYFVDVNSSKFIFNDCEWTGKNGTPFDVENEITKSSHKDIAQICNQIADKYEQNRNYEESADFRYASMEAKRLDFNRKHYSFFNLYSWYKFSSGYGERRLWAGGVLLFSLILFSFLYAMPFSEFNYKNNPRQAAESTVEKICERGFRINGNYSGMNGCESIVHSLSVASFQRPEPKPKNALTSFFITFQTITTPIIAGLLALAIRRKFKR